MAGPAGSSRRSLSPFGRPIHLLLILLLSSSVFATVFTCTGGSVYFVAHPDDDLLFQSPDLYSDITAGNCITHISLTSGDSGQGSAYAQSREAGNEAAWAEMAGVADTWTEFNATFGGQPVLVRTLTAKPQIQKVWFRLPDGDVDGTGYAPTGYETLRELYLGTISSITTQPGNAVFTLMTLKQAISQIMTARVPSIVRTLDYLSELDGGDHSDHLVTGRLVELLAGTYASNASVSGYMGYPISNLAPTLTTSDAGFIAKAAAFATYAPYDTDECASYTACVSAGRGEAYWLLRQYIVTEALAEEASDGVAQEASVLPDGTNVAPLSTVSAIAGWGSTQPPARVIDGEISGYPGNSTAEWASGGTSGVWITLTWPSTYNFTAIVLYDRPNTNDWITGATLSTSGGYTYKVTSLYNDGSATVFNFGSPVIASSMTLSVTSWSSSSSSVGLAEFQAYGTICTGCTQTGAASTSSSNSTSPALTLANDLALNATATASSYSSGQGPDAAIDGLTGGYTDSGGIYTQEWASNGEGAGAWLLLTFPETIVVDTVLLFDRPNLNDQVTSASLEFSDGTSVSVGALNNDGISDTTSNAGLSEIEVFGSVVASSTNSTSNTTYSLADDWALNATAYASSSGSTQPASAAIDGLVGGYTSTGGISTQEWASNGEGAGAWLLLDWTTAIDIQTVLLFDRPNLNDQVTSGTLTFSDGSVVSFGALANDGSQTIVQVGNITSTSVLFTVTSVSSTTSNVGLSEIEVFGTAAATSSNSSSSAFSLANDLALNSTATASSYSSGQDPSAAIDGLTGGYTSSGGIYTQEWASDGQGAGAWLLLTFPQTIVVDTVLLFDRPNLSSAGLSEIEVFGRSSSNSTTPTSYSFTGDIALNATATASSYSTGQPPSAAIDGVIGGYTDSGGDYTKEWSSYGQGAGAIFVLSWDYSVTITSIVLYDRPNLNDQVLSGTLSFSDGSSVPVGTLVNDGSATLVALDGNVTTTSVTFTVDSVSSTTSNVGLSEIQCFGTVAATSGNATTPITYSLTDDWALNATATASSYSSGQPATAAIDGLIGGYTTAGGIYTQEWASNGQGVGAWLLLTWPEAIVVDTVVLYDRPNLNDQVTSASLQFSNGTTVTVGSLINDGSAYPVSISNVSTTSLLFTVTGVSASTSNAGLSEIEVYGSLAPAVVKYVSSPLVMRALLRLTLTSWLQHHKLLLFVGYSYLNVLVERHFVAQLDRHVALNSTSTTSKAGPTNSSTTTGPTSSATAVPTGTSSLNATVSIPTSMSIGANTTSSTSVSPTSIPANGTVTASPTSSSANLTTTSTSKASASLNSTSSSASASQTNSSTSTSHQIEDYHYHYHHYYNHNDHYYDNNVSIRPFTPAQASTVDIALLATASASCANSASPASGAIDGNIGGTSLLGLGNAAQEWKCTGTTKNAVLTLTWDEVYLMKSVVLYGPVNTLNSITASTLTFSDGTTINVGAISSSGTVVSLGTNGVYASSAKLTITGMSLLSSAAGLAEIKIYNAATSTSSSLIGVITGTVSSLLGILGL
ncbi:Carbohydrate-Binding Module Family 1 protein, cellulose binding protein [Pseudohyphozyma bogoriensis]|nr:Carbohydrate-Binding Module Family 1 protein, cellulose binding protein [Pseudohyphozyma bogoriensis]